MATLSMDELSVNYGFAAAFFNADPELASLIQQATSGQWSVPKFQAKFMNTNWYRSHEAGVRQWTDLSFRDPAEAQQKILDSKYSLSDQFTQLGITVDDATLTSLAQQRVQYSWSDAETQNILSNYISYVPGQTGGGVAGIEKQIRGLAYDYGVTVSNGQMQQWIQGMVNQTYTEDSIKDFVTDQARAKYGGFTKQLDAGRSMRDIAGQHIAKYSELMEVHPDSVSLDDPILAKALQGQVDPKTGLPVTQTVFDMQRAVKQDQRWLRTKNARDSMVDLGQGILKDMGLVS